MGSEYSCVPWHRVVHGGARGQTSPFGAALIIALGPLADLGNFHKAGGIAALWSTLYHLLKASRHAADHRSTQPNWDDHLPLYR